ncbi:uncharacterized protein LOC141620747 [Silene latifolia]|uniref:uncharacterized protein LOC141620747 n=1 Tax=Silene latifolia TaxID=37657 RepID=UPI003D78B148
MGEDRVAWRPPANGEWKINVDAAVLGAMGSGLGVAVRDHTGKVERLGVFQVRDMWSSEIAEAKAAEFGLLTAKQMGLDNVVLESDSLILITMLMIERFPANYFSKIGKVVFDLASSFDCIKFSFTCRDGNVVAHGLAHFVLLSYSTRFWVGTVPSCIEPLVAIDAVGIS